MFDLMQWFLKPIIKPFVRLLLGLFVVPLFRLFLQRVVRKELDEELEKDISEWVRGALFLLVATSTMEATFFWWVPPEKDWLLLGMRIMLAIGVIEGMPDQALFLIIHPGPPPLILRKGRRLQDLRAYIWPGIRGMFNQYLNRASAVLAILAVVIDPTVEAEHVLLQRSWVVWVCYGLAITNYLIIGLVCSKDKALGVLSRFDQAIAQRREEIELAIYKHGHPVDSLQTAADGLEFQPPPGTSRP